MKTTLILMIALGALGACSKDRERQGTPLPTAGVGTEGGGERMPTAPPLEPGQEAAGMPPGHPPIGGGGDDAGAEDEMPAGHPPVDGQGGAPAMGGMGQGGGKTLPDGADGTKQLGTFAIAPPKDWKERPTKSSMRAAEWALPGKGGEDAELVVYYFGQGGAGGVDANLERWLGQFQQADGKPSKEVAKIDKTTIDGRPATLVSVEGRYVAAVMPGQSETLDKPAWSMLAAIVEGSDGPYYFKLVGPKSTVDGHAAGFKKMISGMKVAK
jgi:hypothetical protein